jgi:hypothetical protein
MLVRAPELLHATFYIGIESARIRDIIPGPKDYLRRLGSKLPARLGRAGLHDDGPALNRTRDVERTAHSEMLSVVVQDMKLLGIEIYARLHVANEGVVRPAIPKARHHVEELARAAIARRMPHVFLQAEIHSLVRVAGGHHVPASSAAADMVERSEFARHVIGLIVSRGRSGDEPQMLGDDGERRQQRQRIEGGDGGAAL